MPFSIEPDGIDFEDEDWELRFNGNGDLEAHHKPSGETHTFQEGSFAPPGYSVVYGRGFIDMSAHHTEYESNLVNEEVRRWSLESNTAFELYRVEIARKGGQQGLDGLNFDVYDDDNGFVLGSTASDQDHRKNVSNDTPLGTSGSGSDVIARITNTTGQARVVSCTMMGAVVRV